MVMFFRRRLQAGAVARDVERMQRQYGTEAYRVAGEMSWRQDAGLLSAPDDGHWHRVHAEIGRRIGRSPPVCAIDQSRDGSGVDRPEMRGQTSSLPAPQLSLRAAAPAE